MNFKNFLRLSDFSKNDLYEIFKKTIDLKKNKNSEKPLEGKTLAMIFQKSSTRTRISFETGMYQLGGHALFLNPNDMQIGRGESIEDTAKILSGYVDGIMIRTYDHKDIETLAEHASIPVINGLSDMFHPCQALSDIFTIMEKKEWDIEKDNTKNCNKLKLAYIGDGMNMAHSLIDASSIFGINIFAACPKGYEPNEEIVDDAKNRAKKNGGNIIITNDPILAAKDADVIYTDVWISMGKEKEKKKRIKAFKNYQINSELVSYAKKDALIMHCLPAHRGEEITADVIDSKNSIVFAQAGNRLHAQKAIMVLLMQTPPSPLFSKEGEIKK
ncbi:ornithine carbamoyltransferase [bacterium]